ncbi:pyruvate dehydrogenase E1 component subunit alpha-1, mitochondrial-like [Spinacia oleracea]|uniref:Pyruvate dehydrogenase E1 component subunit alpha-1, mitochondrial-like n=1 Tax=Spinacia oleracea TaxID=3562 RepID=A0A9R0JZ34_SPIOL|nr:pyruvate dehydrogenase E1 component subunit alpha-1, mitochondrial-like [Spinacia oleracea]
MAQQSTKPNQLKDLKAELRLRPCIAKWGLVGGTFALRCVMKKKHLKFKPVKELYDHGDTLSKSKLFSRVFRVQHTGIKDLMLSLDCEDYKAEILTADTQASYMNGVIVAEILTADTQASYMNGVIVLDTRHLTGKDNVRRNFTESFFDVDQSAPAAPGAGRSVFLESGVDERDLIERVKKLLLVHDISDVEKEVRKEVDEAIAKAKLICDSRRVPDNSDLFTNIYVKGYGVEAPTEMDKVQVPREEEMGLVGFFSLSES